MPFAETEKQDLIYDILGRQTLHFDPDCVHGDEIDAIRTLKGMDNITFYRDDSTASLVLIMVSEFFFFAAIFQIIAMFCYLKPGCRRPCFSK